MNRSVLIITPFFAPQSHAAVFRAYKLAKYLPVFGWKPYVITTDINYLYNEDCSLLDALPKEVEIYRTRYIEPSLRGVRMAFGGRDRTFKAIKNVSQVEIKKDHFKKQENPLRSGYAYLLDRWLRSPDAYWTWRGPTISQALQLIDDHNIAIVFTSADPYTSHQIGYALRKRRNIRWVADFRDPHTHSFWMHSRYPSVFNRQKKAEGHAIDTADAITVAAESIALILTETYGLKNNHPIHFIPTGLDEGLLNIASEVKLPTYPYLIFVGEYLPGYGDEFFELFAKVVQSPEVAKTGIKLLFIGRRDINYPILKPFIMKHALDDYVEIIDHLSQQDLYRYILQAKAALLIPGKRAGWWRLYAKLVDYIAFQKPTIAIVPNPSEARTHLTNTRLGIFLDSDEDLNVENLRQVILFEPSHNNNSQTDNSRFLALSQVRSFTDLFERFLY